MRKVVDALWIIKSRHSFARNNVKIMFKKKHAFLCGRQVQKEKDSHCWWELFDIRYSGRKSIDSGWKAPFETRVPVHPSSVGILTPSVKNAASYSHMDSCTGLVVIDNNPRINSVFYVFTTVNLLLPTLYFCGQSNKINENSK